MPSAMKRGDTYCIMVSLANMSENIRFSELAEWTTANARVDSLFEEKENGYGNGGLGAYETGGKK